MTTEKRLRALFLFSVLLPGLGLAGVALSAIFDEQAMLEAQQRTRAKDLARHLHVGLREAVAERAARVHEAARAALTGDGDLGVVAAIDSRAIVVDAELNQVSPKPAWGSGDADITIPPRVLYPILRLESEGKHAQALSELDGLGLGSLVVERNVRARLLFELGRVEEALEEYRWLKSQTPAGGLPLSWVAAERELDCLRRLDRPAEARKAAGAALKLLVMSGAQDGAPAAYWHALRSLHRRCEELGAAGDEELNALTERRMAEARVAAELRSLGSLDQATDLQALDARFQLAALRGRRPGWIVLGPALGSEFGIHHVALILPREELEEALEHVVLERAGPDGDAFEVAMGDEGPGLVLVGGLVLAVTPRETPFAEEVARRRVVQRGALLAVLLLGVLVGSLATWRAVRRSADLARARTDFAATVTHELRTPIASIRAMSENLSLGKVPSESRKSEYYTAIAQETQRLGRLIEDVLDLAKVEQGSGLRPALASVDPEDTLEDIVTSYAASGGREVTFQATDGLPNVFMDSRLMGRALENLLSNAFKYGGEDPGVTVKVTRAPGEVVISVSNRGQAIDPEDQKRIFDPFVRGREIAGIQGAGLGLVIVRRIAEAHGGTVSVESAEGTGTTFALRLPAQPTPQEIQT